jgi:cytoskeletal protein CcmA (bactofilin family)
VAESFIFIDRSTSFNGTITAKEVVVEGLIKGDVIALDKVMIKNGGVINGNIRTEKLLFEEGGEHNGLIRLGQPLTEDAESERSFQSLDDEQKESDKDTSEPIRSKKKNTKRLW